MLPEKVQDGLQQRMPKLKALLPKDIPYETFRAAVWLHLNSVRGLFDCRVDSILACTVKAATVGLLPERDCHFLPFNDRRGGGKVATFVPNYQGIIRMLERSGKVAKAFAHPVYEGDHFEIDYLADVFSHKPALHSQRTTVKFYYGCIILKDRTRHVEVMTLDEIEAIKRRAPAQNDGPWQTDPVMMARKTALKRVAKYVQLTQQVEEAMRDEDALPPAPPTDEQHAQNVVDLFGDRQTVYAPQEPSEQVDEDTGEVTMTQPSLV
jgi:recombination protein RecT